MNILPKKRWHVRTKENIARVRKDEAEAAEEEKEKQRRILLAEKEHRTTLLREKARERYNDGVKASESPPPSSDGHVNFFEDIEQGIKDYGFNLEHEKEKKEEKEKYEKKIGLLTYLGQDTVEATGQISWYNKIPDRLSKEASEEETAKIQMKKNLADPLNDMHRYLQMKEGGKGQVKAADKPSVSSLKRKHVEEEPHHSGKRCKNEMERKERLWKKKKERRKHGKHKKKKRRRRSKASSEESCCESSGGEEERKRASIERLRQERLRREAVEAERARAVIAKARGEPLESEDKLLEKDQLIPLQKYNSQFNPHLARQNFSKNDPFAPSGS